VSATSSTFIGGLASTFTSISGSLNGDANQSTNQGQVVNSPFFPTGSVFAGNIHLLTADTSYNLPTMAATPSELQSLFPSNQPLYFSIAKGSGPTGQVSTVFITASAANPTVITIPGFDHYLVHLEQYGVPDPKDDPRSFTDVGISGLLGADPPAPSVTNADPLSDERSEFNELATFALGELRLDYVGGEIEFAIRRSDQDRIIVKDNGGNDAFDEVTPNPDLGPDGFTDVADPRFQPAAPTVKVPVKDKYDATGTRFSEVNNLRRAAVTTMLANQLYDVAQRTGQTRFAVDGRIIDISGYQK
jgi:hypothetical protein